MFAKQNVRIKRNVVVNVYGAEPTQVKKQKPLVFVAVKKFEPARTPKVKVVRSHNAQPFRLRQQQNVVELRQFLWRRVYWARKGTYVREWTVLLAPNQPKVRRKLGEHRDKRVVRKRLPSDAMVPPHI